MNESEKVREEFRSRYEGHGCDLNISSVRAMLGTAWKNLLERRRKRKAMRRVVEAMAKIEPHVRRSLIHNAFKAAGKYSFPKGVMVSGAVQVGENVWVAGIQREVSW